MPGKIDPDDGVGSLPDERPDGAVVAVDYPAITGRRIRDTAAELLGWQRNPVRLMEDGIEFHEGHAEVPGELTGDGGFSRT